MKLCICEKFTQVLRRTLNREKYSKKNCCWCLCENLFNHDYLFPTLSSPIIELTKNLSFFPKLQKNFSRNGEKSAKDEKNDKQNLRCDINSCNTVIMKITDWLLYFDWISIIIGRTKSTDQRCFPNYMH